MGIKMGIVFPSTRFKEILRKDSDSLVIYVSPFAAVNYIYICSAQMD
jgi:hypothetical protein